MRSLPYGENDFDLILIGIALCAIAIFALVVVLGLLGLVLGIVGIYRKPPRRASAIGALASVLAFILAGVSLWA